MAKPVGNLESISIALEEEVMDLVLMVTKNVGLMMLKMMMVVVEMMAVAVVVEMEETVENKSKP